MHLLYRFAVLLPLMVLGALTCSQAQKITETGSWLMYFGQNRLHESWSLHTEAQYRGVPVVPELRQLLLRTGINYHISSSALITAGYASITNYDETQQLLVSENRIWQQYIMTQTVGRVFFQHRYRLEQRWFAGERSDYANRARYRIMAQVPLDAPEISASRWFLGFYEEVFVNFKETFFDQNRLYAALGYRWSKNLNLQAGYLSHYINHASRSRLQLAVFWNPDLRKLL